MKHFLGIEIGGTKLQLVVGDEQANILHRWRFAVEENGGGAGIRSKIASVLPEILSAHPISMIGVGYGGPVDWRTGTICCSHQVEGWSDFPLGSWLRERAGSPVIVDNDANVAALGEACRGAGQGSNPVFYVTLGSGVGGGLVVDRKIFHGAKPGEAELGHVRMDRAGTIVEQRCSGWAVDARIRAFAAQSPSSILARLSAGMDRGQARALEPALREKCPIAQAILREVAHDLGFALSHVAHLVHPEVIVLGGGLSLIGESLRVAVEDSLGGFLMKAFAPGPRVVLAALREDSVPVGALLLAGSAS